VDRIAAGEPAVVVLIDYSHNFGETVDKGLSEPKSFASV
jgi:hypothetical protein